MFNAEVRFTQLLLIYVRQSRTKVTIHHGKKWYYVPWEEKATIQLSHTVARHTNTLMLSNTQKSYFMTDELVDRIILWSQKCSFFP